ncbi:mitochondrial 18 KDa protein-domain-containing protein [Aspergillus avenaceus]|uniref:Mitochondrial fission process protein 1 n=1 Tax=Aspergillus avenaceus TaxID=36643 RepID=A0A5N6TZM9_ASPAV|nr:mitochondrial 18 KDa protein-domain-containing protein [Aspergillus avenaceus]
MFWGSHSDDNAEVTHEPLPRQKLPPQLQKLVDRDDGFYDDIYSPYSVDSTNTPYRYAGYANRLRTILLSAHRYVAYTSDIGESFRPVAHPYLVRSAYAISWSYLIGDVAHEGYKAYLRNRRVLAPPCEAYKDAKDLSQEDIAKGMATGNISGPLRAGDSPDTLTPWPTTKIPLIEDYRLIMGKRAVFQSVASMGLPALTIHSIVKYSGRALKNSKSVFFRTWAPIGLGLSVVPFLPYIFDEPVEEAVEWSFRKAVRAFAGEDAVRPLPHIQTPDRDLTSLSHFFLAQEEKDNNVALGADASTLANTSWEEYKEERRQAKEHRKRHLEQNGHKGPWAMLGFGSGDEKRKSD